MAMTPVRRRLFQLVAVLGVVLVAVFLVARDRSSDDGSTVPPPEQGVLPLLGTPGRIPQRPALAVKVDATDRGRPQTGLAQADVVFEELVEGGLTRLMAVYHSQDPGTVGPVRSARSTDVDLLAELGRPLFAWSGANHVFAAEVESADLVDVGFDAVPDAYRRDANRPAPYNLYASPESLRAAGAAGDADDGDDSDDAGGAGHEPPPALFDYRAAGEPLAGSGVAPSTGYRTRGGVLTTSFAWDWDAQSRTWLRSQDGTPHVDVDGHQLGVANVLIQETAYRDSGIRDSRGAVVPEVEAVGEGDVWLLSDGQVQPGRWQRPSIDAPTTYTARGGTPLQLSPGQTWVEVLPPDTGDVL